MCNNRRNMISLICIIAVATVITENTGITLTLGGIIFLIWHIGKFIKRVVEIELALKNNTDKINKMETEVNRIHDTILRCNQCRKASKENEE